MLFLMQSLSYTACQALDMPVIQQSLWALATKTTCLVQGRRAVLRTHKAEKLMHALKGECFRVTEVILAADSERGGLGGAQRVLRDYRKVERRLLARVAERDAALEAAAAERLNGGLLGRKQARAPGLVRRPGGLSHVSRRPFYLTCKRLRAKEHACVYGLLLAPERKWLRA